ncbi:type II toxin-antitoxin system RelE/ParE family toxin [Candidatus Woesearchaeota archaeon]|jgi:addiction module RelE/StbE family toxin|nr:type II toxin-antitoxin system RelE/ParE family toxin [Candidatus Woesearchaeota archaeon]MBT6519917.1 type II toxin-antitoxin system RelE/ParE family toxin [Candidatus Woesearchaeota archaeon]MBT7367107.1 type II toxin-antitoxin system RelE/ParE family toxin [Candidatus Woesearchaeota archaeon]
MEIIFSESFKKDFKRIKEKSLRLRLIKQIKKLATLPDSGKPLKHNLKNHRSIRIPPFRIIYRIEDDKIIINCFDHRKAVYK